MRGSATSDLALIPTVSRQAYAPLCFVVPRAMNTLFVFTQLACPLRFAIAYNGCRILAFPQRAVDDRGQGVVWMTQTCFASRTREDRNTRAVGRVVEARDCSIVLACCGSTPSTTAAHTCGRIRTPLTQTMTILWFGHQGSIQLNAVDQASTLNRSTLVIGTVRYR